MAVKVKRWTKHKTLPICLTPFKPLYPLGDLEATQTRCFHIGGKVPSEGMAYQKGWHFVVDNHPHDSYCVRQGTVFSIRMVFCREVPVRPVRSNRSGANSPKVDLTLRKVFASCWIGTSSVNITDEEVRYGLTCLVSVMFFSSFSNHETHEQSMVITEAFQLAIYSHTAQVMYLGHSGRGRLCGHSRTWG